MLRNTKITWSVKTVPMALILAGLAISMLGGGTLNTPEINTETIKVQSNKETASFLLRSGIGIIVLGAAVFVLTNKLVLNRFQL